MEPLSSDALMMLVQALDRYRTGVLVDAKSEKTPAKEKDELLVYLSQIDNVFDELKEHYDACRAENPSMVPMRELIRGYHE